MHGDEIHCKSNASKSWKAITVNWIALKSGSKINGEMGSSFPGYLHSGIIESNIVIVQYVSLPIVNP